MDWIHVEARWKLASSKVKNKWVKLTDEDLKAIEGRRERLERKIEERYGFAADYVRKEVDDWVRWQRSLGSQRRNRKTRLASLGMRWQKNHTRRNITAIVRPDLQVTAGR